MNDYRLDPTIAYDVISLPSQGIYYPNKKKTIKVAYLTAADENILSSPSLIANNMVVDELLKRKILDKDLLYQYLTQLNALRLKFQMGYAGQFVVIAKYTRAYLDALHLMNPTQINYPDANGTMRLSYGTVEDYYPRDAVHYQYQTWLSGVIAKMDNSNPEFVVPDNLLQAWKNKNFGPYAVNGDVPVCFLTNNDIIGGNSGSPVLNGKGELIGLAFDGDLEGTTADYNFDPNMNRTICVDIRYVLFCIDKLGNAQNIMSELHVNQ